MRVLLADDEPKVREALHLILDQLQEVEIIGDVSDAAGLVEQMQASHPDLLLLDWELPGLDSVDALKALRQTAGPFKVIVMSGRCPGKQELQAAEVDAFVSKCESPDRLFAALKAVGAD